MDLCLDISNNFLSNKNNLNETGAGSNHVKDKMKISPDKKLVQYLKDYILNRNYELTKNTKMTTDENKKKSPFCSPSLFSGKFHENVNEFFKKFDRASTINITNISQINNSPLYCLQSRTGVMTKRAIRPRC